MHELLNLDCTQSALVYQKFTFPSYQRWLDTESLNASSVAIGAIDSNIPIGLALARLLPNSRSAVVLSVYVTPSHRCQGIGASLLSRLEEKLISRGSIEANLTYTTGQKSISIFERLLQSSNWTTPSVQQLVCKCNRQTLSAPWLQKDYPLPNSFTIFPWVEITCQERLTIQQQQEEQPWIPADLVPFQHEENLEPLNSLGLRYQGEVVGWLLTHRIDPETIRYTCSFIRKDLQRFGRLIPLYVEAVKRQARLLPDSNVTWTVPVIHTSMVSFVKKHLAPYMISFEESRSSYKILNNI
jgi:GNAT superfamily N-acetyltransferase